MDQRMHQGFLAAGEVSRQGVLKTWVEAQNRNRPGHGLVAAKDD